MRASKILLLFIFLSSSMIFAANATPQPIGHVEESLILDKDASLQFLKDEKLKAFYFNSLARPGKCPFKSTSRQDLISKLEEITAGLRNGHCDQNHQDLVSSLTSMTAAVRNGMILRHAVTAGGLYYSVDGNTSQEEPKAPAKLSTPDSTQANATTTKKKASDDTTETNEETDDEASSAAKGRQLLHNLTEATSDTKCVEQIRSAGLVSAIADIAINVGQISLFVPSPNGLSLGLGTIAFGATLKILAGLLKSPFAWELEKDRMQFLDLNCNFYDIRKELEEADFFDVRGDDQKTKTAEAKEQLEKLTAEISEIIKSKIRFETHVTELKNKFLKERMGDERVELLSLLEKADKILTAGKGSAPEARIKASTALLSIAPRLSLLIETQIHEAYGTYVIDLLKPFMNLNLVMLNGIKTDIWKSRFLYPLETHFRMIRELLNKDVLLYLPIFESEKLSEKKTNKDVIDFGTKVYSEILAEFLDKKAQLAKRISLYELKSRKTLFGSYEDGAHADFDVLREYLDSQNLIYGSRGWGFLHYLIKRAYSDLNHFEKQYADWSKKYLDQESLDDLALGWGCRDAQNLRVHWNSAFAAVGLTHDFYETNKGIMTSDFHKYKRLFHHISIPVRSDRYRISSNMRALEMAKSMINGKTQFTDQSVADVYKHKGHNLGIIALLIKRSETMRQSVDDFIKKHSCHTHL